MSVARAKILIVDDYAPFTERLKSLLETELSCDCSIAYDDVTAMQLLASGGPFSVMFLDLNLPGDQGVFLTRISETYEGQMALVITTYGFQPDDYRVYRASEIYSVSGFVDKRDEEEFVRLTEVLLRRSA